MKHTPNTSNMRSHFLFEREVIMANSPSRIICWAESTYIEMEIPRTRNNLRPRITRIGTNAEADVRLRRKTETERPSCGAWRQQPPAELRPGGWQTCLPFPPGRLSGCLWQRATCFLFVRSPYSRSFVLFAGPPFQGLVQARELTVSALLIIDIIDASILNMPNYQQ